MIRAEFAIAAIAFGATVAVAPQELRRQAQKG
jgi:hypothetical protein